MLCSLIALALHAAPIVDFQYDRSITALLECIDAGAEVPLEATLDDFRASLASEAFDHEAVGPIDVYLLRADGLERASAARKVMRRVVDGLEPLVPVLERHFGREDGVVSGRRYPIVLAESRRDEGEEAFDGLVAWLDHCESGPDGWKHANGPLWTDELRSSLVVRTWEVQLFNFAHEQAADDEFLEHGLGYHVIAHLVNRVYRRGTWGSVPPWLAHGTIDEIDIEAYGEAYVGGDWFETQTGGWYSPGWSGFLPEGAAPPPAPSGPPAGLTTTRRNAGDRWAHRSNSKTRHWSDLREVVEDGEPVGVAAMTADERFGSRDRAYARCLMNLLLDVAPAEDGGLLALADRESETPPHGMPMAEPLTVAVSRALGGVAEVERLESIDSATLLAELGLDELADEIVGLGAEEALTLSDHREQSQWLYRKPTIPMHRRQRLFELFLEIEFHQQRAEWHALGAVLDDAVAAAFEESSRYPSRRSAREDVAEVFRAALTTGASEDGRDPTRIARR